MLHLISVAFCQWCHFHSIGRCVLCACEMQEVSVLASDCATMLIDIAAIPDGSYRLLSQLVAEATFPANLTALKMINARLDEDFEVTNTKLTTLVSCLLKVGYVRCSRVVQAGRSTHSPICTSLQIQVAAVR